MAGLGWLGQKKDVWRCLQLKLPFPLKKYGCSKLRSFEFCSLHGGINWIFSRTYCAGEWSVVLCKRFFCTLTKFNGKLIDLGTVFKGEEIFKAIGRQISAKDQRRAQPTLMCLWAPNKDYGISSKDTQSSHHSILLSSGFLRWFISKPVSEFY